MTDQLVTERNWAGNYSYQASRIARPRTLGELQELVAGSTAIRALGSRHSFNDIADTTGTLAVLDGSIQGSAWTPGT
ncbi:probable xylitol oxidase [Arthrobacter sp. Hiyo6]|nr:probable xylitol oxidase [Arthrobacter sp. Hiyo6]